MAAGLQINHEARRITLPPGVIRPNDYACLWRLLPVTAQDERMTVGRLLEQAHGCGSRQVRNTACDACWDNAMVTTLEAEGWTIVRETTGQPDGVVR